MSLWLLLAIFAQFLFAVTVLIDKHVVVRVAHIGRPIVYTFVVSILSGFVIVIAPFGLVSLPSADTLRLSVLYAVSFAGALFFLYSSLRVARASDVAPVVGAVSTMTTLLLAGFFIEGDISASIIPPIVLLAGGTALISHFHFSYRAFGRVALSGLLFGLSVFVAKLVFIGTPFLDGFFWTRAMGVFVALSLFVVPSWRNAIFYGGKHSSSGGRALVIGNKFVGGTASILTAYAISLGSVSVVNALAGLQFVFLFIFALFFADRMPQLKDNGISHGHGGWHTALGVALVALGVALVYLTHSNLL